MPPQPPSASAGPQATRDARPLPNSLKMVAAKRPTTPPETPARPGFLHILEGFETFLCPPNTDSYRSPTTPATMAVSAMLNTYHSRPKAWNEKNSDTAP